jgi:hypothetical protein
MLRKILFIFVVMLPLLAQAQSSTEISKYLLGHWKVEAIKKEGSTVYTAPKHPTKWEFTSNGTLIEELGTQGAKVDWRYRVVGQDIKVQLGGMAFSWKVLSMEPKVMFIKHQLGILKVIRL